MKSLIVDDVEANRNALKILIEKYCPDIDEVILANSGKMAKTILEQQQIAILFLDIEMPQMSGFDLIEALNEINFDIVFVTAYDNYALKAFKYEAVHYLLKPVNIPELQEAVQRIKKRNKKARKNEVRHFLELVENSQKEDIISIFSKTTIDFVKVDELIRCEADGRYTKCILSDNREIFSSKNLKEYEIALQGKGFLRIHHSHLVNKSHIRQFIKKKTGAIKLSNGEIVPISQRKRESIMEAFKK